MNNKVNSQEKNGFKYYLNIFVNIATILIICYVFVCVLVPSLNLISWGSSFFVIVSALILAALNFYIRK